MLEAIDRNGVLPMPGGLKNLMGNRRNSGPPHRVISLTHRTSETMT
jgi:hypothetical protein